MQIDSIDKARHFLGRFGFGHAQLEPFLGREATELLDEWAAAAQGDQRGAPVLGDAQAYSQAQPSQGGSRAQRRALYQRDRDRLGAWGMQRLVSGRSALEQRMIVFWHNHFTSSVRKARFLPLLLAQRARIEREALGSFASLLRSMIKDPALLLYLDANKNKAAQPNENLARELLELFTLGEGHYSESDVLNGARALVGWGVNPKTGAFRAQPTRRSTLKFLGQSGAFDGDDLVEILLARPETAQRIVHKLWLEYIDMQPQPRLVERWAAQFQREGYQLLPLLHRIARSDVFWQAQGALIKSPIDLTVGFIHQTGAQAALEGDDFLGLWKMNARLGQRLFDPPSVEGWSGGQSWITTTSLLERQRIVDKLARENKGQGDMGMGASMVSVATPSASTSLAARMLPFASEARTLEAVLRDPSYQLR